MTTREEDVERLRAMANQREAAAKNMRGDPEDAYDEAMFLDRMAAALDSLPPDDGLEMAAKVADDRAAVSRSAAAGWRNKEARDQRDVEDYERFAFYNDMCAGTADMIATDIRNLRSQPPQACAAMPSEGELREMLAAEIKRRGGPDEYLKMLANKWMEIDSELPPELSAPLAAMQALATRMKP